MADAKSKLAEAKVVLCSACLLGEPCRFDGRDKLSPGVRAALEGKRVIPICPEVAGGLGVPRPPCSVEGGTGDDVLAGTAKVVSEGGADVTLQFVAGARAAVEAAAASGATVAVLKERSPSCGCSQIWSGGAVVVGRGVTAAALDAAGVAVLSSEALEAG